MVNHKHHHVAPRHPVDEAIQNMIGIRRVVELGDVIVDRLQILLCTLREQVRCTCMPSGQGFLGLEIADGFDL